MKRGIVTALVAILILSISGCGDAMPDMTDEQEDLIAEYSAMLLLKHSNNYNYRIADEDEVELSIFEDSKILKAAVEEAQNQKEEENPENKENSEAEDTSKTQEKETITVETGKKDSEDEDTPDEEENDGEVSDEETSDEETPNEETPNEEGTEDDTLYAEDVDFAALLGIDDTYELTFESMETTDSYPSSSFSSSGFQIIASRGKQLVVLHFKLKNISGAKVHCDMMDINPNIKLSVNGNDYKDIENTLLVNDLTAYISDMEAGETVNLVGIMETSASSIKSVDLLLSIKNEKITMVVYQ